MQTPSFTKFAFRIRTRIGVVVDNLLIHGRDAADAERKLRQMYHGCEILDCACHTTRERPPVPASYEDVLGLISH